MTPSRRNLISTLLMVSVVGDLGLAALALLWPDLWFRLAHGVPRVDPEHILTRTGVVWLTFALFHLVAWFVWRSRPYWLAIVAGMPMSEIFADHSWMLAADHMTTLGRIGFVLAGIANVGLAVFFVRSYLLAAREMTSS
ncbi:MAG TPA: hypothetical protein VF092_26445 [Longimicrobium sp.]